MTRLRLTWVLPVVFVLITSGLWFWSNAQYRAFVRSTITVNGSTPEWEALAWTDYTPVPLELAGALNVPVATFAYPLYELLDRETSVVKLLVLLIGVGVQWSYVGWAWDSRRTRRSSRAGRLFAMLGIFFGILVVFASMPMHHVAIIYKTAAIIWAVSICWHFARFFKKPTPAVR
jgi:hypothetical protein